LHHGGFDLESSRRRQGYLGPVDIGLCDVVSITGDHTRLAVQDIVTITPGDLGWRTGYG
jgi:hypothetical protein